MADFTKAPEGATHYAVSLCGEVSWYRKGRTGQVLLHHPIGGWVVTNMSLDGVKVKTIIDFSSAPDGATHYMPVAGGVLWYCGANGATSHWRDGKWGMSYLSLDTPLMLRIPNAKPPKSK